MIERVHEYDHETTCARRKLIARARWSAFWIHMYLFFFADLTKHSEESVNVSTSLKHYHSVQHLLLDVLWLRSCPVAIPAAASFRRCQFGRADQGWHTGHPAAAQKCTQGWECVQVCMHISTFITSAYMYGYPLSGLTITCVQIQHLFPYIYVYIPHIYIPICPCPCHALFH